MNRHPSLGWLIFTAVWTVLSVVSAAWYHREVTATDGRAAAWRTTVVLLGSALVYAAVCVLVSFALAGQLLAVVASGAVLAIGRTWITIPGHIRWLLEKKGGPR